MKNSNVVLFPLKKRNLSRINTWQETFPKAVVREFGDFKSLKPHSRKPAKSRIEYMERFIRIHGLAAAVLIDEQNAVLGGHDVLKKARAGKAWGSYAFLITLKRPCDKWALVQAYKNMNQKRRGGK